MNRKALVYYRDSRVGELVEDEDGYCFTYDEEYVKSENAMPVSLTLPLQGNAFHSKVLFSFFDGLIPEGWLLNVAQEHWKLRGNDRFELLMSLCRDAIGAVSVIPADEVGYV